MSRIDKEEKTAVICPECGKRLKTWGTRYFNHCGKRQSVTDNLDLETDKSPEETLFSEDDLEQGETLVKCSKCGEFLITTETETFTHCETAQSVKDSIADFTDFNGGGENEEKDEIPKGEDKGTKAPSSKTRAVLSNGKDTRSDGAGKKKQKVAETRDEEGKLVEGEKDPADTGETNEETDEPDKEEEVWTCIECGCVYTDNGYSDAKCPECECEYAAPYVEEE